MQLVRLAEAYLYDADSATQDVDLLAGQLYFGFLEEILVEMQGTLGVIGAAVGGGGGEHPSSTPNGGGAQTRNDRKGIRTAEEELPPPEGQKP